MRGDYGEIRDGLTTGSRRGMSHAMTSSAPQPKLQLTDAEAWEAFRSLPLDGTDLYTRLHAHLSTSGFFGADGDTLEVGAGDGFLWEGEGAFLVDLAVARGRLVLTDRDHGCVAACRERVGRTHPGVIVEAADVARLVYPAASFARVIAVHVLHWCESPDSLRAAVAGLARVIRPDARALVVTVDAAVHMAEVYALMHEAQARLRSRGLHLGVEIPQQPPRISRFSADNAESYLRASFGEVRVLPIEYAHRVVGAHPRLPISGEDLVVRYVEGAPFLRAAPDDRHTLEAFFDEMRGLVASSIHASGAFRVSRRDVVYDCRFPLHHATD